MIVELVGKSVKGLFALAKNQGCKGFHSLVRREDGLWRLRVTLPGQQQ